MAFPHHHESRATLNAGIETAFAYLDRFEALSAHMNERSAMMMGSRMHIETDERGGRAVGSMVRMRGRVLGMDVFLEQVVTERAPPRSKTWQTVAVKLVVIGPYRLGFKLAPAEGRSELRVFIDYDAPGWPGGRAMASVYARWCTWRMARDAARRFESGMRLRRA